MKTNNKELLYIYKKYRDIWFIIFKYNKEKTILYWKKDNNIDGKNLVIIEIRNALPYIILGNSLFVFGTVKIL